MGGLAFGILAPAAAQGAAFEEYDGSYAFPIMDGKALDIEDHPVHGGQHAGVLSYSQYCWYLINAGLVTLQRCTYYSLKA